MSATARRSGTSQPTISRALARLRELFGDPLLIRTNAGMDLTRRAEELLEPLQDWLAQTDSLLVHRAFEPASLQRCFRIASTDFGMVSVISSAIPRLHEEAPGVRLDVVAFTDSMFGKLGSGEIDLIVSGLDPDNSVIYSKRLFTMTTSCVMRADHPLARQAGDRLSFDQFLQWPHISILVGENGFDRVETLLGERASERKIIAATPYFQTAHTMLVNSDAIALLPEPAVHHLATASRLACRKAPEIIPPLDYWVLWHERSRRDPATMWLIDMLSDASAALDG